MNLSGRIKNHANLLHLQKEEEICKTTAQETANLANNRNDELSPKQQRYAERQNKGEKRLIRSRKENVSSDVTGQR